MQPTPFLMGNAASAVAMVVSLTLEVGTLCSAPGGQGWFLAGSFSSDPIVRRCEVPAEKSLFFPLINTFYGAFLNDPPETRTEEFVREAGRCTVPATISVWIDGFEVRRPTRFFTGVGGSQSPLFNLQMPPIRWIASGCTPGNAQDITYHLTVVGGAPDH